jgi:hypothetical protein
LKNSNVHESPKRRTFSTLLMLTAGLCLCACAGISVEGTWQDGATRSQRFSRVLIVGVSPDRNLRCSFEATLASQLRSAATTVFSSCDLMNSAEPLTRENLERVIAQVHADAVLATRLVSAKNSHGQGNSTDMRGDSRYKAIDNGYGVYGMPVTYAEFQTAQPLQSITNSIHIVTNLYSTSTASLVYSIDTKTKSQEIGSTQATLYAIAAPTAQRLRREGLVR